MNERENILDYSSKPEESKVEDEKIDGVDSTPLTPAEIKKVMGVDKVPKNINLGTYFVVVLSLISIILFSLYIISNTNTLNPPIPTTVSTPIPQPTGEQPTKTRNIPQATSTSSVSLISKSASDIGLMINDMPVGWEGSGEGNETYYSSSFNTIKYGSPTFVDSKVEKYSSEDKTKQAFSNLMQEFKNYKLVSVSLGDESFGYEFDTDSHVVFRKTNLIVTTDILKNYGATIREAKDFAKIVERKIVS